MRGLIKIQVLCGDKVLAVCEFGPETSNSVLEDIEKGELDMACKCICAVASINEENKFFSPTTNKGECCE